MDIFKAIEQNIRIFAKKKGITLNELIASIEMTEGGFYRMLTTGSMKIRTLEKISEKLEEPIKVFFDDVSSQYEHVKPAQTVLSEPLEDYTIDFYRNERTILRENIDLLKGTIEDKNRIIELLSKK